MFHLTSRRWFQFSIRTLLLIVTALSIWLAAQMNRVRSQRAAVACVRSLGGRLTYDYQLARLKGPPVPMWIRELLGDDYFVRIVQVDLSHTSATDVTMKDLSGLGSLRSLDLRFTQIGDTALKTLNGLGNLRELSLEATNVTNEGVQHLLRFRRLTTLNLASTHITDEGVARLTRLQNLECLRLGDCDHVTDASLKELIKFQGLVDLDVAETPISSAGIPRLSGLRSLERLWVDRNQARGDGLAHLREMPKLTRIWLAYEDDVVDVRRQVKQALPEVTITVFERVRKSD